MRRYLIREGKITSVEFAAPGSDETVINANRFFGKRHAGRSMPSRHGKALGGRTSTPRWRARTMPGPQSWFDLSATIALLIAIGAVASWVAAFLVIF